MKHYLSQADYVLWIAGLLLEILILAAGIYRKHYRRHPAFLSYVGISAAKTLTLMYVAQRGDYGAYYMAYWLGMMVKSGFLGWLVWEIFRDVFKSFRSVPKPIRSSLIVMAACCVLALGSLPPTHHPNSVETFFNTLDRSINFAVVLLVWSVTFNSDLLRIPKTVNVYGICAGLFFTLVLDGVISAMGWAGLKQQSILRMISMSGFVIAELVWFRYMMFAAPAVDVYAKKKIAWVTENLQTQAMCNVSRKIS